MVFEFRGIFLDISIAFDKILHDTLNFERQNGIINILQDFLSDRKQRAFLNGHYSSWADFRAGVTQGSIFRPLMFYQVIYQVILKVNSNCLLRD